MRGNLVHSVSAKPSVSPSRPGRELTCSSVVLQKDLERLGEGVPSLIPHSVSLTRTKTLNSGICSSKDQNQTPCFGVLP